MKALIVDDERLARTELRRLLQEHPDVEISGEATNADEAERALAALDVDLLLLDVQMPGATGFDLLERLERVPMVVFTTAYDAYALQAFEANALDYLVKPIRPERLASALDKVRTQLTLTVGSVERQQNNSAGSASAAVIVNPLKKLATDRIFIREGERCWIVAVADVSLIDAEGNYSRVHFSTHHPLVRTSLQSLEDRLDPSIFFRASRSQLFNLRFVESVENNIDESLIVKLKTGQAVNVSRRQSRRLRDSLGLSMRS